MGVIMPNIISHCRMCGTDENVDTITVREMMFGSGEEFVYESCNACQSLQIKEIPNDLLRHYPDNYSNFLKNDTKSIKVRLRSFFVQNILRIYFSKFQFFRRIIPSPSRGDLLALAAANPTKKDKILDVGCGRDPFLLRLLSQLGFTNLTGADPFALKEEVLPGNIRLLKRDLYGIEEKFDIVVLNHSLEHTADPQSDLIQIARVLKLGGRAVVRLPTPSSKAYAVFGVDWVQLDAPRHLNLPSRKAMKKMIERAGLSIRESFDDSGELQFYGSKLFKENISLTSPTARTQFTKKEMREFRRLAKELNSKNFGDQVTYILSH